ncbi:phage tail protein [Solibacillus sp.]|uniref:phage tail protein n=1 Tax=Solibacillus sp. TaxID=1909654 RepID=UPI003314BEC6
MAVIGSFGPIVFEVTTDKIQTFDNFKRSIEPRYVEHKIQRLKPRLEFEGEGIDSINISILLKVELGINPEKEMKKIREYIAKGRRDLFIRGNSPISPNYFVIKRADESHNRIDNLGNVLEIAVQLELKEYVEDNTSANNKPTVKSVKASNPSPAANATGTMKITVKSVHIRSGPGVNNKVLGYAMKGDELKVYGIENGWYKLGGGKYITASDAYSSFKGASK